MLSFINVVIIVGKDKNVGITGKKTDNIGNIFFNV